MSMRKMQWPEGDCINDRAIEWQSTVLVFGEQGY